MAKGSKAKLKPKSFLLLYGGAFGLAVLAALAGYGVWSVAIFAVMVIALPFVAEDQLKIKKDWHKAVIALTGVFVLAGAFASPNVASEFVNNAISGVATAVTGAAGTPSGEARIGGADITQEDNTQKGTSIITTTATVTISAENFANKTLDLVNPSGYYSKGGSYTSLSFTSGSATIASLDPFAQLDKVSVGTDGTFYWRQVENFNLNGDLSPKIAIRTVRVCALPDLRVYSTLYADQTNGTANQSVGSGGSMKGFIRIECTSSSAGIRAPVIAHSVNGTAVSDALMPGLQLVTCPSGIFTDTVERSLFRCYDTGVAWFLSSDARSNVEAELGSPVVYGFKDFQTEVQYKTGVNPIDAGICNTAAPTNGHGDRIVMFDRDEHYRAPATQLYFTDPPTGNTNLGSTLTTAITWCPS